MSLHQTSGRWRLGLGLALFTAFLWALAPIAMKVVLEAMDPYSVSWYRFLLSAVLLSLYLPRRYGLRFLGGNKRTAGWLLAAAALGLCLNYALFTLGLDYLTPGATVVIIQTAPMFLLLGGIVVFRESYSRGQVLGFAAMLLGLGLFFNLRIPEFLSGLTGYTLGTLLMLGAGLTWAVYAVAQKQLLNFFPSPTIMWVMYWAGTLFFLPFSHPASLFELSALNLALLIFCGLNTIFGYGAFSEALAHLEASRVSAVLALTPLMTLALMYPLELFLPGWVAAEPLNALSIVGALLVVGGSLLSSLARR